MTQSPLVNRYSAEAEEIVAAATKAGGVFPSPERAVVAISAFLDASDVVAREINILAAMQLHITALQIIVGRLSIGNAPKPKRARGSKG